MTNNKFKICLIGNDYVQQFPLISYGGIESCVENLAFGIAKYKDIALTVIVPKRDPNYKFIHSDDFEIIETDEPPTSISKQSPEKFCLEVKEIIKRTNSDIIWSQSHWSAKILHDLNIPIICTFHDSCTKQPGWIIKQNNIKYRFLSMFQYNNWIKENWEKACSFQCYSGLTDDEYVYFDHTERKDYFLWCAGLQWGFEAKGLDIFLQLAQNNPNKRFIAYGAGNDQLSKALQEIKLSNFQFLGSLSRGEEHKKVFGCAKALVMPTQIPDTFPRTCLEAISKGTPIIGSILGSIPEIVNNNNCGIICNTIEEYNYGLNLNFNTEQIFIASQKFNISNEIDTLLYYSTKL